MLAAGDSSLPCTSQMLMTRYGVISTFDRGTARYRMLPTQHCISMCATGVVYIWHTSLLHLACCAGSHAVCTVCWGCDNPATRMAPAGGCKPAGALLGGAKGLQQA